MATTTDLGLRGFTRASVAAKTTNISHPDPTGLGPFCRLTVEDTAPERPGVYAWVVDGSVMYVGKASVLRQIVHGTRMGRAYNDYTYVPASKVAQTSNPRVRINGLLNKAVCEGSDVSWWWLVLESSESATRSEAELINAWRPPWNRALPGAPGLGAPRPPQT